MGRKYDSLARDPLISLFLACKCMLQRRLESVLSAQEPSFSEKGQLGRFLLAEEPCTSLPASLVLNPNRTQVESTCQRAKGPTGPSIDFTPK